MIKLTDIDDRTGWKYLDENPDFVNQLLATLNQVDGFSSNELEFYADGLVWTYDYRFSSNYEIDKKAFIMRNDQIQIRSTNRDDLLNLNYYQRLNDLANNYHSVEEWKWFYYAQDQVLQLESYWWSYSYLNIKLTKPIDQYDQKQINAMGKFMTNVRDLINKDGELDWEQFDDQWKETFSEVRNVGLVFDLNDFANPKILLRWWDENDDNRYENDLLKQVLKDNSSLLTYLKQFEQDAYNHINQVDPSKLVNQKQEEIKINDDFQPLTSNFDLYIGANGKTMIAALNNLVKNIKAIVQYDDSIKQWFLSDLKIIHQEEQALYTISGLLNIIIN